METPRKNRGPWTHRLMIYFFSVLLGLFSFWLLSFVISDIGSLPGPSYAEIEKEFVSQSLLDEKKGLAERLAEIGRKTKRQASRQKLLRDSTSTSQQTMNQLLEMQRLSLQKGIELNEAERKALADSEALFLSNQKQYQVLNSEIAGLKEEQHSLEENQRALESKLTKQREPAQQRYQELRQRHNIRVAALQLAVLIPLLLVVLAAFVKKRGGTFAPIIYAVGIAVVLKVGLVMHHHFPTRWFKYILLLVSIGIVFRILVHLLRMLAAPKMGWLLKQYREAYDRFLCPVCGYPIRRGPLRYLAWTARSIKKTTSPLGSEVDEAYTCPACGTALYTQCESCQGIRHGLLPFCEKCGAEREIAAG